MEICLLLLAILQLVFTQNDFDFVIQPTSVGTTSASITYTVSPIEGVVGRTNITTVYVSPCPDAVSIQTSIIQGFSNFTTITGLEEFSDYDIIMNLTLTNGRTGRGIIRIITQGAMPGSVSNFRQIAATTTSITVAWDSLPCLEENSRIDEYIVRYRDLPSGSPLTMVVPPSGNSQHTVTSLTIDTSYSFTLVVGYSVSESSGTPLEGDVTQMITVSTFEIPGPFNLMATSTETTITLSWLQEMPLMNAARYNISAVYLGPCTSLINMAPMIMTRRITGMGMGGSWNRITFSDLVPHGNYNLTVTTISRNAMRMATATINAWTMVDIPDGPPLSLNVVESDVFSLHLAWSPPRCEDQRGEILTYNLYYGPSSTYSDVMSRQMIPLITSTRTQIFGLIPDTSYSIQVEATNLEGTGPLHSIVNGRTLQPLPPVTDLTTVSTTSTTVTLGWTQTDIRYSLVALYIGPCINAGIEPLRRSIDGSSSQNTYELTGLHEHSNYLLYVWPELSVINATTLAITTTADPIIADNYVRVRDVNETTIALDVPPLDCIDMNTEVLSPYTIRYGLEEEFVNNTNVFNSSFVPGGLTIGSLLPGTNYSIEITISTGDGREVVLGPVKETTIGVAPSSTNRPPSATQEPTAQIPIVAVIIVAIVVACIVVALSSILVVCFIVSCKRKAAKNKQREQNDLNDMSRVAEQLKERGLQDKPKPPITHDGGKVKTEGYVRKVGSQKGSDSKRKSGSQRGYDSSKRKSGHKSDYDSAKRKSESPFGYESTKQKTGSKSTKEKKEKKRKSLSKASKVTQDDRPFSFSSIGQRKSNPFSSLNWMNIMTENATMATENTEIFDLMNADDHDNLLVFDEKNFEYEGTQTETSGNEATGGTDMGAVAYKFESQVMDVHELDTEEESTSQKNERGCHYEDGFESDEDYDGEFNYKY